MYLHVSHNFHSILLCKHILIFINWSICHSNVQCLTYEYLSVTQILLWMSTFTLSMLQEQMLYAFFPCSNFLKISHAKLGPLSVGDSRVAWVVCGVTGTGTSIHP